MIRLARLLLVPAVMACLSMATVTQASANTVQVKIDISTQTMNVSVGGRPYGSWKVSTARAGYHTPRGKYRVQRMARVYFSKKYDNAPMPNAIFFKGGYAIHGTNMVRSLGRPASHGCIRLHPGNARALFDLVREYGPGAVTVSIID